MFDGLYKEQIAEIFGVRTEQIDTWARNGMPVQQKGRKPGGQGRHRRSGYNLADCCEWLASIKNKNMHKNADEVAQAEVDYRREKTRMQEIRRKQLEGKLVDVRVWQEKTAEACETIKKGMESLQRSFGDEVVDAVNAIIDDCEAVLLADFNKNEDKDEDADGD